MFFRILGALPGLAARAHGKSTRTPIDIARLSSYVRKNHVSGSWRSITGYALGGCLAGAVGFQILGSGPRLNNETMIISRVEDEASDVNTVPYSNTPQSPHASIPDPIAPAQQPNHRSEALSSPQGPWVMDEEMKLVIHRR